jgi:hypothetical protein
MLGNRCTSLATVDRRNASLSLIPSRRRQKSNSDVYAASRWILRRSISARYATTRCDPAALFAEACLHPGQQLLIGQLPHVLHDVLLPSRISPHAFGAQTRERDADTSRGLLDANVTETCDEAQRRGPSNAT